MKYLLLGLAFIIGCSDKKEMSDNHQKSSHLEEKYLFIKMKLNSDTICFKDHLHVKAFF